MQGTLGARQQVITRHLPAVEIIAANLRWQRTIGQDVTRWRGAGANGIEPLVLANAVKKLGNLGFLTESQLFLQGLLKCVGDQCGPHFYIAHEPAQRQLIDQGCNRVSDACQHKQ